MAIKVFSAATAHGIFENNITREEAWDRLTIMFNKKVFLGSGLYPGGYRLTPFKKLVETEVNVGDVYTVGTFNTPDNYVIVIEWDPFNKFSYEEQFREASDHQPKARRRMDVEVTEGNDGLVLDILRREKEKVSIFRRDKGRAKDVLEYALRGMVRQLGLKSLEIVREDDLRRDF